MSHEIPEEIKAMLKVRVNHDLEPRDTGTWIASVSAYKALHAQQERIATLLASHKRLVEALNGLIVRHRDGSEEQYWAEWDTAIPALREAEAITKE